MPQYERGYNGQEIGEMQQRLSDLGFEVPVTNEFDEYTEQALRRYQQDWLYADGSGVADEETLNQLEYHHSTRPAGETGGLQFGLIDEETQAQLDRIGPDHGQTGGPQYGEQPAYGDGAGGSSQGFGEGQWDPYANPTPAIDSQAVETAVTETYQEVAQEAGELWDGVVDQASKIVSGEEPMPDVRN